MSTIWTGNTSSVDCDLISVSRLAHDMAQWEVHRLRNVVATMLLTARAMSGDAGRLIAEMESIHDDYRDDMLAALRDPSARAGRPAA